MRDNKEYPGIEAERVSAATVSEETGPAAAVKESGGFLPALGEWFGRKKRFFLLFFCGLSVAVVFALVLYYIFGPSRGYYHSDDTDSLFWAQATYDSGKIISPNYNYAGILPFSANIWFIPLIALFGVTMKAQLIGMAIFALVFTLSVYFVCRSMKWGFPWCAVAICAMLLVLSSSDQLLDIMWRHVIYYSLSLLLLFVGMGLAFRALDLNGFWDKNHPVGRVVWWPLLFLFTLCTATDGFQIVILSSLPIMVGMLGERIFDGDTRFFSRRNKMMFATVIIMGVALIAGTKLLSILKGDVVAAYAEGHSVYTNMDNWIANLQGLPKQFLTLIGLDIQEGTKVSSLKSIGYMLRIAMGILLLVSPIILLAGYRRIQDRYTKILLFAHLVITAFILFGYIFGNLSNANWRWTPMVGSGALVSIACIRFLVHQKKAPMRVGVIFCVLVVLFSALNFNIIRKKPVDYGQDGKYYVLARRLEEEGLEYGYATFWNAQVITLLSDSKVRTRSIAVTNSSITPDYYQSQYTWYLDQEGVEEYFIAFETAQYFSLKESAYWSKMSSHVTRRFTVAGYFVVVMDQNIF